MRTARPPFRLAAALALALLAPGCGIAGFRGGSSSRELSTAQFDDVPVPASFVLDLSEGRSFTYSEGGSGPAALRMGRLEYTGRGDASGILDWYAAEMPRPIHGWGAAEPAATGALLFRRGADRCLVSAREEGTGLRIVVERNTGGAAE